MKVLLALLGVAWFGAGCTTVNFRPYVGAQQVWPQSAGGIVNTRYALPVFMCLPSADYEVIGEFRFSGPLRSPASEDNLPVLVKNAREQGAEALLLVDGPQFFTMSTALAAQHKPAGQQSSHVSEVRTAGASRGGGGRGGGGVRGGSASVAGSVMSYGPNVVVLAIRWVDGPPNGLPRIAATK
ncbi:MAG: hypothetical protein PCFJNLEI_01184 [Verrucomicrobiae bacterium]|nr:hypothetical protein [Verrucomicrobiae bacterium]